MAGVAGAADLRRRAADAATVRAFHARFGLKIHSFYGTTETGGIAFDDDDDICTTERWSGVRCRASTIDAEARTTAMPTARRDPRPQCAVTDGYSDATREGFEDAGFLTGDYGVVDNAQRLTLLGRISSFVNVAGT